jgi:hypothetical protein
MSDALREALALIEAAGTEARLPAAPLPSLLARCEAEVAAAPDPAPIRLVHHFACTGGTLIARALSVMPAVTLISEIDPLSPIGLPARGATPPFRPHDLIFGGLVATRPITDAQAASVFAAGLGALHADLQADARHLVLRDHTHSQFCTDTDPGARPTLAAIAARVAPVRSVVTVRHPVESFLSLVAQGWTEPPTATLDGYARRYHLFLDAYPDAAIFRYEDLTADPEPVLERMCRALALPFRPGAGGRLRLARLSGESGRSGTRIAPRPPKPVPDELAREARQSAALAGLCARLGYDGPLPHDPLPDPRVDPGTQTGSNPD